MLIDFDKPEKGLFASFDWWGLLGLAGFLGAMEYVLEEGPGHDWLNDQAVMVCAIIMVLGGVLFFVRAFTAKSPIVDLSSFGDINFTFGSLFSFVLGVGLYGLTYLYPVFLGRIRGYDSMMIGETLFISGLAMFFTAPIAGALSARFDLRYMLLVGFLIFAGGTFMSSQITADWSFDELLWPQIFRGVGMMLCMVSINNLALGTLPKHKLKGASGLFNLTRNLGGAVGLAVINTVLTSRTALHTERLSEHINWANPAALSQLNSMTANDNASGLDGATAAIRQLANMVAQQANVLSFIDVFLLLTVLFAGLAFGTLLMRKPAAAAGAGGGH
jgi:DHA2 family multidrug resistance protein